MLLINKREGSLGQQQKGWQMVASRKIVAVKTFVDVSDIFVKGIIQKSYGNTTRPAVILFNGHVPKKGVCCHILAILLYLKKYNQTGETILSLTCTEQIQKWHRRVKKGSIPMIPLREIGLELTKKT